MDIIDVRETGSRPVIGSFERYEDAKALVDRLVASGFPVERLAIVGRELEIVEEVVGDRPRLWRPALAGAACGALAGALFGWLFGVLFTHDGVSLAAVVFYWFGAGAMVGAAYELLAFALAGGWRDFASTVAMQASRYDVLADESVAEEALRQLGLDPAPQPSPAL